jgi:hypothetical protein
MQPIERDSCKHAIALGWEAVKLNPQGQIGLPDRMFVGPKRKLFFCEFKRPGEPLSPSQRRKIKRWGLLGWTIYVVDDLKLFKDIIKEYNK